MNNFDGATSIFQHCDLSRLGFISLGSSKSLCALLAVARCFIFLICYDSGVHKVMDFVDYN